MMDLMGYLRHHFVIQLEENGRIEDTLPESDKAINAFVHFCKKHLKGDPPVSVFMAGYGPVLRLADGTEITLLEPSEELVLTRRFR